MHLLKDRIAKVMESTGWNRTRIAIEADVSKGAVTQWLSGDTQELKGPSAANLSRSSGFRAQWLIDGKGSMMSDAVGAKPDLDEETERFLNAYGYLLKTFPAKMRANAHGQAIQVLLQLLQECEPQDQSDSREVGRPLGAQT